MTTFQQALQSTIPENVKFDRFARATHATDASVYQILPEAVITPQSTDDVVQVVNICRQHGASITARGGGTSQAGQAIGAGVSLDFSKHMNQIVDLDVAARSVTVQPGIVLAELNAALKPHGLQLPLDLSTANRATVGGMIANNSAGTRSIIYGKTIDYVEELDVVLADGSQIHIEALDAASLDEKLAQQDLEGALYRRVDQLGRDHAEEIERRYPKIQRRVGGYNLDSFVPTATGDLTATPFNLARIFVGSEGTLGLTTQAKLRIVPLPTKRTVCCVQFESVLEAMRATSVILTHNPSAVELVDSFILDTTRGRTEFEPLRSFIVGDPGAVLIVEFLTDSDEDLSPRVDKLETDLQTRSLGHHLYRAPNAAAQQQIWTLRQAALGLTMSVKGTDAKGISFVEDTAVPPEMLPEYIENFQRILAENETEAGFYAHASVGLLHVRPVVNMKTAVGVARFETIAAEVSDLVLEYGGAISGEHGDGLVRAPFQEKVFGPILYEAFCLLKATFDPENIFNPGKIVHAPALTTNLRFGPDYITPEFETAFDFSDFGGLLPATEQCSGVGACRKTLTGTMCPSYMATRNEIDSTRGRANALRQALAGQLDASGLTDHELKPVMDLCLECKACKSECPTGVDMARLKSEFQHQYRQAHGTPFRERILARMEQISIWGSRFAPFSNWIAQNGLVRWLNERLLGIDRRRPLPLFAQTPFTGDQKKISARAQMVNSATDAATQQPIVALFADTFNNFYEPRHLHAAERLLAHADVQVEVVPRVCCGRPLISKGFLDQAAKQAAATTATLLPLVKRGVPILFCEPSCYSAVIDDHPKLLRGQAQIDAQRVANACSLVDTWLVENAKLPDMLVSSTGSTQVPQKILVHGHCHQKALDGTGTLKQIFATLPTSEVSVVDSGCCGLAGLFGYENYEVSQAIGERRLLPAVRDVDEHAAVVSMGFSCRQQIKHFTGVEAHSPMSLLAGLIDEEKG